MLLHHDFREFMLAAAKDRRKEDESTSVSLPHSFFHSYISLLNKPWRSINRSSGGAVHVGFPLCCGSIILVPNSEVCSLRIHTSDSRQEAKQSSSDCEVKRGTVATSCVPISVWGCWDTVQSHCSVTEEHQERDGFHQVALDLNPWRPGQGNGQGYISPTDEAETQLMKERDKVVQNQSRAGIRVSPVAPAALLWENTHIFLGQENHLPPYGEWDKPSFTS